MMDDCLFVLLMISCCCCLHLVSGKGCVYPRLAKNAEAFEERQSRYPEGSYFYYKCKPEYHFQGNQVKKHKIQCKHGRWLPLELYTCYDECNNTCIPGHGECVKSIDKLRYSCYCKPNFVGQYCDQRVCESIPSPEHGILELVSGYKENGKYSIGSRLNLRCDAGYSYSAKRNSFLICGLNGWSKFSVPFVCQRQNCSAPPNVRNAMKLQKDYSVGEFVKYTCYKNYIMVGDRRLKCDENLSWYGNVPVCYTNNEFKQHCLKQSMQMVWSRGTYVCANRKSQTTKSVVQVRQSSSTKPLVIVTATAGGLLLLLLLVISLVAFQRRRIVRANMRHGRQRLNSDDDRYSFVYYSNNLHVVLPSYDEAIQTHRQIQLPPYLSEDNANGNLEGVRESNGSSNGSEYATIDDVIPERRTPSNSSVSCSEPLYATIQRGTPACTTGAEEGTSNNTVASQNGFPLQCQDSVTGENICGMDETPDNISLSSVEGEDVQPLIK